MVSLASTWAELELSFRGVSLNSLQTEYVIRPISMISIGGRGRSYMEVNVTETSTRFSAERTITFTAT